VEVQINNHEIQFQLENEKTVSEVVTSISNWTSERELVFCEVHIDGDQYLVDDIPDLDIEAVNTVNCIVQSKSDVIFSSMDEGARYCSRAVDFINRLLSDEEVDIEQFRFLSSGIDWLMEVISSVVQLTGIDTKKMKFKDKPVADHIVELAMLRDEIEGIEQRDDLKKYFKDRGIIFSIFKEIFRMFLLSDEMRDLIMKSIDSPDVLMNSLMAIREGLPDNLKNIEEIAIAFQAGRDADGAEGLNRFVEFIFNYTRICFQVVPVFGVELSELVVDDVDLEEKNSELQSLLNETMEIMENDDIISLSDILEYEMKPALEDLDVYIDLLVSRIDAG